MFSNRPVRNFFHVIPLLLAIPVLGEPQFRPLLEKYCHSCHGPEKQKGDLRFDTLPVEPSAKDFDGETWHDALDQLNLGEMPPPKEKLQPTAQERQALTDALTQILDKEAGLKKEQAGHVHLRRLTRDAYQNTMAELLGVRLDYSKDLPPEPASPDGFLNDGATLETSPSQLEAYLAAARRGLAEAIPEGDKPEVFTFQAQETAVGQLPAKRDGGATPVNPEFLLDVKKFPREGEFKVTIHAGANIPEGEAFPRLRVSIGNVAGIIHVPRKVVGEAEVSAPLDKPQTFTFTGRMEDFPQSGDRDFGNSPFKGIIVMVDFLTADGKELRYKDRAYVAPIPKPKAKKGEEPPPPPPPLPKGATGTRLDIAIASITYEAPVLTFWPPESRQRLLTSCDCDEESDRLKDDIPAFLRAAFRRPPTDAEVGQYATLFEQMRGRTDTYEAAIKEVFAAILVSPHFLYIVEPGGEKHRPLTNHELATRLAYFLRDSQPDATLSELADQGQLTDPAILRRETDRLLGSPEAKGRFLKNFANQWFDLDALDRVAVNPEFYPGFDNSLKEGMREEPVAFLAEILATDGSCLDVLDSDWTMANHSLAIHFGLTVVPATCQCSQVTLQGGVRRGGILGQAAFLVGQSNGEYAHPIKRAVFILDKLLDTPPAPPPPDVPGLAATNPATKTPFTIKERLALHREKESCGNCHKNIDPWGIPLQQFDAIGLPRDTSPVRLSGKKPPQTGAPIDTSSELPDGTAIHGEAQLKNFLLEERRDFFARSISKKLLTYALGRSLAPSDRKTVKSLQTTLVENDYRLRPLLHAIVQSAAFRTK